MSRTGPGYEPGLGKNGVSFGSLRLKTGRVMQMRDNLVPGVSTIYKGLTTVMGMGMGVVERGIFKSREGNVVVDLE